jgi:hypothetical protein
MLANQFAGAQGLAADFDPKGVNATAYAGRTDRDIRVAVINKDAALDMQLQINPGMKFRLAGLWRLSAPGLDATESVDLAGREVASDSSWLPGVSVLRPGAHGFLKVDVPHASGLLAFFQATRI